MSTWWHTARTDQRMKQVQSGVELGMSALQIALATGCNRQAITDFGRNHQIKLPKTSGRQISRAKRVVMAKKTIKTYGVISDFALNLRPSDDDVFLDEVSQ